MMARGKYAARAANARADAANESVTGLREQLAAQHSEHRRQVAELTSEITRLQGRLEKEVRTLAAAEVERVQTEARAQLAAERKKHRERIVKAAQLLDDWDLRFQGGQWVALCDALGVSPRDVAPADVSRANRRVSRAQLESKMNDAVLEMFGEVRSGTAQHS